MQRSPHTLDDENINEVPLLYKLKVEFEFSLVLTLNYRKISC